MKSTYIKRKIFNTQLKETLYEYYILIDIFINT